MSLVQLQLFPTRPVMLFECPCGSTEWKTWPDAVYTGWHVPANMRQLEEDGRRIIALCRTCNMSYAVTALWRWNAPDNDIFHWLQRQEETPNTVELTYCEICLEYAVTTRQDRHLCNKHREMYDMAYFNGRRNFTHWWAQMLNTGEVEP